MKTLIRIVVVSVVVIAIAGALIWGFRAGRGEQAAEEQREAPVQAPSHISSENGHTVLNFDAEAQRTNGIKVSVLKPTEQRVEEQATGVVVQLQPLLDLKANYNTAATTLIQTRANARVSHAEFERLRQLNRDGKNASDKALEAASASAESDAALVQNAEQATTVLKANAQLHWGAVVADWLEGNSPQLDALLRQQRFLLQVTGTGIARSAAPKQVLVQFPDGKHEQAKFVSVLPQLDPRFQVPSLLYQFDAHAGIVPGVNLTVFLPSGSMKPGVNVPSSAIVWSQGTPWCYVEAATGKFVRTAVDETNPMPGGWFVTEGIDRNARVVTSGAQTLLSEEFRSQIQADQD